MTDELITRLAAANPVPHDGPLQVATPTRLRPSRRLVLGGTVAMAALAVAGIAVADGLGPFSGISSVQHPQTTGDLVDPATEAYLERTGCTQPTGQPCAPMISGLQFDAARRLAQLPDGQNVYVIPRTGTDADPDVNLCTIVGPPDATTECRSTVTQSHPSTMLAYLAINHSDSSATRWFIFGVAIDGATSVSFDLGEEADGAPTGPRVTVPVNNNSWIYAGPPGDLHAPSVTQPLVVHFANGTTVTMPTTGPNCAAC